MKVNFEVGAKAARLIGRENIADVDGALSELIKNAYDADASCVYVDFYIPFSDVPSQIEPDRISSILVEEDYKRVMSYYHLEEKGFLRNSDISEGEKLELQNILFSYNRIIIIDNGEGMTMNVVSSDWMQIATSNKESRIQSEKGRIKTGAKGIGRFALDKLSVQSVMYTKSRENDAIRWEVNWDQFSKAHLLRDVYADVQETDEPFEKIIASTLDQGAVEAISKFRWETGTMFILTPLREAWSPRLFAKVNTNLKSINPLGSADEFLVIVRNQTMPKYSYQTEKVAISEKDYDYKIEVDYDGGKTLKIKITRNEFDMRKEYALFSAGEIEQQFPLEQFWSRPAFAQKPYQKEDMDGKARVISVDVDELFHAQDKDKIHAVGPFEAELYFVKNGKSDFSFVKDVPTRRRKDLLMRFSGVKLYRDDFKVRPYGDEGSMFDWLDLNGRANKSPASVSHLHGQWRVLPYQMIGVVKIGRVKNAALYDMANREGLTQNESYYYFVSMLQEAIGHFEDDRQYIYREYARWKKECEDSISTSAQRVTEDVRLHGVNRQAGVGQEGKGQSSGYDTGRTQFSEKQYREAIEYQIRKEDHDLKAKQTLELISSAGVILNTFFHEFRAVQTQLSTRASQMRARIDNILDGNPYQGRKFLDPYRKLEDIEHTDKMLSSWLHVAMRAIEKDGLNAENILLADEVNKIAKIWKQLLEEKSINLRVFPEEVPDNFCRMNLALVDLYVIINNFILNAVSFLEKKYQESRDISISLAEEKQTIVMNLENNGPALSERYKETPMAIFNIGETEKENGTGLGLFLMHEVVDRTSGKIRLIEKTDGFGIEIKWPK